MRSNYTFLHSYHRGFTLIETIVGIVVLAISFSVLTSLIYPISEQSAEQLHQVKAAELAQSMLNEIQNKAFDENSDMAGGRIRCGEPSAPTCSTIMGPEDGNNGRDDNDEDTRDLFDDVDDYHNAVEIKDSQGHYLNLYTGYTMSITVCNDSDYDGVCEVGTSTAEISTAKLITVTITTPTDFSMSFSTYRANF